MQRIKRLFDIGEIENIVDEVTRCMSEANIPEGALDTCFNPGVARLLASARATEEKIRGQQNKHARFVFDSLLQEGAFNWDRGDSSKAFKKDIRQYKKLVSDSMRSGYPELLDWAIRYHRQTYQLSDAVEEYTNNLTQIKIAVAQQARNDRNEQAANGLEAYYDHLINSSSWFDEL